MSRTEPPRAVRVSRRRRVRGIAGSWLAFYLACGLIIVLALLALASTLWRRADSTLADIQQADPRERVTRTTNSIDPLPSVTPQSSGAELTALPALPTLRPTTAVVETPEPAALPASLESPFNILLLGVDKRLEAIEGVRSDTLIVVRVNPQERWASMLSIPRDTVVNVPNLGWSKINGAYSFGYNNAEAIYGAGTQQDAGGGALAAETVEQFLGIGIDYTAQIDFQGFEQVVDTLGGIVVDVQKPLLDGEYPTENYGYQRIYIPAGLQNLDGRTALIYARTRHASSDFERSRRQQQVLRALLDQVRDRGVLENAALLPQWADVLRNNVRTTMPIRDFTFLNGLALLARELRGDRVLQLSINPNDVAITHEDGSDLYWDPNDVALLVERWQRGPTAE